MPLASVCSKYKLLGQVLRMLLFREKPDQEILFYIDDLIDEERVHKSKEIKLTKFKYVLPDKK